MQPFEKRNFEQVRLSNKCQVRSLATHFFVSLAMGSFIAVPQMESIRTLRRKRRKLYRFRVIFYKQNALPWLRKAPFAPYMPEY